jgi:hypothetical protein
MPQKSKRITHIPLEQRDPRTVRAVVLARMSDPNAKDVSMEGQVEECEAFIERRAASLGRGRTAHRQTRRRRSGGVEFRAVGA